MKFDDRFWLALAVFVISVATILNSIALDRHIQSHSLFHSTLIMKLEEMQIKLDSLYADRHEVMCLAKNLYFEAGNQSYEGKLAVGEVVMNRVRASSFPDTPCAVIEQPYQFSWTVDGKHDIPDYSSFAWNSSYDAALEILGRQKNRILGPRVHFYHADYVMPRWTTSMERVTKIGQHIFYRKQES